MSRIPDEVIDQVREAADVVELIGRHVDLKRSGSDYRGPCPFHGGTHRNFSVVPKKGMYHCFVCHASGDVFRFYTQHLGLDYPSAVRAVAETVGITIPERGPVGPDPREPFYQCLATAQEWYAAQLTHHAEAAVARRYLAERGVPEEAVVNFGLGYAPRGDGFLGAMRGLGVDDEALEETGLVVKRDQEPVRPRFWHRLLFPIHDLRSRVVGFGGRVLGQGTPKYLNSPDTSIFHKGRLLYHLDRAKTSIRRDERALLVEGYFDVMRLVGAGIHSVVAPLGTGLTAEQAALLRRYTTHVVLLYDSDDAGLRATFRAGDVLLAAGVRVSVVTLPAGEDPDSVLVRGGRRALDPLLRRATDILDRKLQLLEGRGWLATLPGRRRALDRILPTLRAAADPVTRELYVGRVAESLGVRPDVIDQEIHNTAPSGTRTGRRTVAPRRAAAPLPTTYAERALIAVWLQGSPWSERVRDAVNVMGVDSVFEDTTLRALYQALEGGLAPEELDEGLAPAYEEARTGLGGFESDEVLDSAVRKLKARPLRRELRELERRLAVTPPERKAELVQRKRELALEANALDPQFKVTSRSATGIGEKA